MRACTYVRRRCRGVDTAGRTTNAEGAPTDEACTGKAGRGEHARHYMGSMNALQQSHNSVQ